jgi:single-strand DNA-binding protein
VSKDLNKVMIIGRLGADPELRFTPQGSPVTTFRVASGRQWKNADSTTHEETEWFRVVVWNKLAEVCNDQLRKGSRVYIEGRVQTRKWQNQAGQDRYTTEVIVSEVIMLEGRRDNASAESYNQANEAETMAPRETVPMPAPASSGDDANRRSPAVSRTRAPRRA